MIQDSTYVDRLGLKPSTKVLKTGRTNGIIYQAEYTEEYKI